MTQKVFGKFPFFVGVAHPRFATKQKVIHVHIGQFHVTTIFTIRLIGETLSLCRAGWGIATVVSAPIKFDGMSWLHNLIIVRGQSLEGRAAVKEIGSRVPPIPTAEVALFNNRHNVVVDGDVGLDNGESTLCGFDIHVRGSDGVIVGVKEPNVTGQLLVRPHKVMVDQGVTVVQHQIEQIVEWIANDHVHVKHNHNWMLRQSKGFEFEKLLFAATPCFPTITDSQ